MDIDADEHTRDSQARGKTEMRSGWINMPVPDFQSLMLPMLRLASDRQPHSMQGFRDKLTTELGLTKEALSERLPSGMQTVFVNRVAWAAVYLNRAGALERLERGIFKITKRGEDLLSKAHPKITVGVLSKYPEFSAFRKASHRDNGATKKLQTPGEQLAAAHKILCDTLATELLDAVKKVEPDSFERLVLDLLGAMGYGKRGKGAIVAVGKPGDEGLDGVINEDSLGMDVVYVQAKRWTNPVGRPVVQAFAGSLDGARAKKGVVITTSVFTQDARDYVRKIEKRIVLIDGEQLAELMIEHNVGVAVEDTYAIKRLDANYFENL